MSAKHFLTHLALAYRHFHTIDEHTQQLNFLARQRLKSELISHLASVEKRSKELTGNDLSKLQSRILALKQKVESS